MNKETNVIGHEVKMGKVEMGHFNVIDGNVQIGKNVKIGNHCVIRGDIEIGDDTVIENSISIVNTVHIGKRNRIFPNTSIGYPAQHLTPHDISGKFIHIGDDNILRESVTVHLPFAEPETFIGNSCFLMANTHISHDTHVCDNAIIANNSAIGGHSWIGKFANLGLNCCLHQYCRIGDYAMVGMGSVITKDVLPFHLITGTGEAIKQTINRVGFSRNYKGNITSLDLAKMREFIRRNKNAKGSSENPELKAMIDDFIKNSKRDYYIL